MAVHIDINAQKFIRKLADISPADTTPRDWRTPGRFADFRNYRAARSILECPPSAVLPRRTGGGPPSLSPEAYQTMPMLSAGE
jgi:hypothetical protein